ncbi:MFS transporter [Dehalococcoidia bacterium]|nr:MFS transporter [Dehalococcoidia bacterium]
MDRSRRSEGEKTPTTYKSEGNSEELGKLESTGGHVSPRKSGTAGMGSRTFISFKNPVFRLYYLAMLGQMAAMNMQMFTRSFLVFTLTGSYAALGLMALASAIPMLFFSLFGGVIADRVQKRHVLLVGQSASAAVSLSVGLTLTLGFTSIDNTGSWTILVVASLAQGTIMGLMMPSRQAMISDIVGEEELMNAVSLNTLGQNSMRILGPAIAGFLVESFGYAPVYYAMTGMYLTSVVFISLMRNTGTITLQGRGAMGDIIDGFRYIRNEPTILIILVITFLTVLLSMPYMMLLPGFAVDILKVGAWGGGVLMTVSGIGAMAGSLVLASLPNKKRGLMLILGSLVLGMALTGFSFSESWSLSLVLIVFVGVGQTVRMTLGSTLIQYYVANEYRGRVMSLYFMEFGLTSFGVFFTALLAERIGPQWSVGGLAILLVFLSLFVLAFVPRMRKLD